METKTTTVGETTTQSVGVTETQEFMKQVRKEAKEIKNEEESK